jgi:hypothetical protein
MKQPANRLLLWAPRVLAILFAAFISIFALDVFGEGYSFWETIVALVMHLVPTAVVLVALAIAWRWQRVGGLLFIALGLLYILIFREGDWIAYLLISGPLFLTGALFLLSGWYHART